MRWQHRIENYFDGGGEMKNKIAVLICGMIVVTLSAWAQADKAKDEKRTVSQVLNGSVSNMEREFVSAAEAMPEDKFNFAPTSGEFKGVRTFGQQIKHVAAVNYLLGAAILQEKPPVDIGDESGPASITSKADIVKYLKESFEYVHKAIGTINESNLVGTVKSPFGEGTVSRLGLATVVATHGFDHYGQMVEYLRMNGIVPPASR
ncbi:MAG: DinB family protein [Candidatus Sulfotelmatobacter sp.]